MVVQMRVLTGLLITLVLVINSNEETLVTQLRREVHEMFLPLKDSLMPSSMAEELFFHVLSYYAPIDAKSTQCRNDSSLYVESALKNDLWALQMFDASSKIEAGSLEGYLQPLGNYDACVNIDSSATFTGQHCVVEMLSTSMPILQKISTQDDDLVLPSVPYSLFLSVCVPSSCSYDDVYTHMSVALKPMNVTIKMNSWSCSSRYATPWDTKSIVAGFIVCVFVGLVLLTTCFDCIFYTNKRVKSSCLLSSFSLYKNLSKLCATSTKDLPSINGLRFIATVWIVMGHRFLISVTVPTFNLRSIEYYFQSWTMAVFHNVALGVEIFLFISGLLVTYTFLKNRENLKNFNIIKFYIHRYLRLTPSFAMMMLVDGYLLYHLGDGPVWKRLVGPHQEVCDQRWWTNLLYITNYYYPATIRGCLPQTWYLSTDMQLFLFSPLILIPLHKKPTLGLVLICGCLVATVTAAFINATQNELKGGSIIHLARQSDRNLDLEYTKTHLRAASYFMGMALGYVVFKFKQGHMKVKLTRCSLLLGWLLSLTLILTSIFSITIFQDIELQTSQLVHSLFISLSRPLFTLGIMWIVFVGITGYGGIITTMLSSSIFTTLSTLSYGIYLTHLSVQLYDTSRSRVPYNMTLFDTITKSVSDTVISLLAALILFLVIEAPFIEIDKWFFSKDKKNKIGNEEVPRLPAHVCQKTKL